jgi:hypothetical protein
MDSMTLSMIKESIPKLNPKIAGGYSTYRMKNAMVYIDAVAKSLNNVFPPEVRYMKLRMATPFETIRLRTKPGTKDKSRREAKNGDRFPTDKNDVFLCYLVFDVSGETVEHPIFLNYLRDFNIYYLRDTPYMLSPVLADNGLSIHDTYIFIALSTVRLKFFRMTHSYVINDYDHQHEFIVHSNFYNGLKDKKNSITSAQPLLANYMFINFGIKTVFDDIVGTQLVDIIETDGSEYEKYPKDSFVHCHQSGRRPRDMRNGEYVYTNTGIRLIFRKDFLKSRVASKMVAAFFYLLDHFGENVTINNLKSIEEEKWFWRTCLGAIHFHDVEIMRRVERVTGHVETIDVYIDEPSQAVLAGAGIEIDDTYELFYHMIEHMDRIMQEAADRSNLYNKRVLVETFALGPIENAINMFKMNLKNRNDDISTPDKFLTKIRNNGKYSIHTETAKQLLKSSGKVKHGEVDFASYPGDCPVIKITTNLTRQEVVSNDNSLEIKPDDPVNHLHASMGEVVSHISALKSDLTGLGRLNPFVELDQNGFIVRKEELRPYVEEAHKWIRRV